MAHVKRKERVKWEIESERQVQVRRRSLHITYQETAGVGETTEWGIWDNDDIEGFSGEKDEVLDN